MKQFLFLTLTFLVLSCKKDEDIALQPEPVVDYYLKHSGIAAGVAFDMDTNSISSNIYDSYVIDEDLYRYVGVTVWMNGETFDVDSVSNVAYAFHLEVIVQYSFSELTSNGQMPPLKASKLAAAINDSNFEWNDGEEMKDLSIVRREGTYSTAMNGGSLFVIENPQVHATAIGNNSISIVGSVDNLMIDFNPDIFATDVQFDYTIPVPN